MQVAARMTPNPVAVTPRDTLAKARALMHAGGFRRLPVVEEGELVGILSERDLRQHLGYLESTRV
ncbi:MAG TPA: CBS domain-containing protein, partial [Candidatus Binataceae bacterium]|nr:CBS domain-containing protein [Candidatus Binataceae bacterium]